MTKKGVLVFLGMLAMILLVGQSVFAVSKQRTEIDKFLKSYEEVVVAAEKAAKSNKLADLITVQQKALKLTEQADKIQGYDEWTTKDSEKYLGLTNRYTKAATALTNSAGAGTITF
jgi:type II secretory pathway pseudopilin PulG